MLHDMGADCGAPREPVANGKPKATMSLERESPHRGCPAAVDGSALSGPASLRVRRRFPELREAETGIDL